MIIDAQIHVWPAGLEEHAEEIFHHFLGPDGVLDEMDRAGVDRAVIVPPGKGANDFSLDLARRHPDRFAVMEVLPLNRPEARERAEHWSDRPAGLLGVRLAMPPWRPTSWITDGTADWFWPVAEREGIPVMIWAPGQYDVVRRIAEQHPGVRLIVDHFGMYIDVKDDAIRPAIEPVLALHDLPNIGVKLSALPCYSTEQYPFENLHEPIRLAFEAFGPDRLFWGSDLTRLPCPYSQAIDLFTKELPFLSAEDIDKIMGRSLSTWLNWP
jgi:L-fuconolactonase